MIATILPGSFNFHAVGYNEHKVSKGTARLLEIKNFGPIGQFGAYTPEELTDYLTQYSSRNDRIKKAQFHLAISCKGHESTEQQLLDFAHDYLKEMGYGSEGQPLLVYSHYDTDNTHIHIVTSRVAPNGKKIDHNNERRRSQMVINKLLGLDQENGTKTALENALSYDICKLTHLKAILISMGYEVYDKDDVLYIKKGGIIQTKVNINHINHHFKNFELDRKRARQLNAIFCKYRDISNNKEQLQQLLKKNFGIDLVFWGKKDTPYGFSIIDHKNKTVIDGSHVIKIKELLNFTTPEEKILNIDNFIKKLLDTEPLLDTFSINKKLSRSNSWIKNGILHYGNQEHPLDPDISKVIKRNNRIKAASKFNPRTTPERDLLCRIFRIDNNDLLSVADNDAITEEYDNTLDKLKKLFNLYSGKELRAAIRGEGIIIKRQGKECFAICNTTLTIIHLNKEDVNINRLYEIPNRQIKNKKTNLSQIPSGDGVQGHNREWELEKKDKYDKVDDHIDSGLKM